MIKRFDEKKYLVIGIIFIIGFLFAPVSVKAATSLYFNLEDPVIYKDDIFLVDFKIATPDRSINVIDGTLLYDSDKLEIKEISTDASLIALWSKEPVIANGSLSFVGGIPDGFQGEEGNIFRIVFLAKNEGQVDINFLDGFSVFLNDGQGTQLNPWITPFSLDILERPVDIQPKDEWQDLIKKDETPPEPFEIFVGQNQAIFNNQYFASWFTTDKGSGVAYYQIKEEGSDYSQAVSPYLLKNQSLQGSINIKAVDKAGNETIAVLTLTTPAVEVEVKPEIKPVTELAEECFCKIHAGWLAIGFIFLVIIFILGWLWKTKLKNKIQNEE